MESDTPRHAPELYDTNYSDRRVYKASEIAEVIRWEKTSRGGKQFDKLADLIEPTACASSYGLCT